MTISYKNKITNHHTKETKSADTTKQAQIGSPTFALVAIPTKPTQEKAPVSKVYKQKNAMPTVNQPDP